MATDATGTPTTKGIPKYNPSVDAPSGLGFNAAMDTIDSLLSDRVTAAGATLVQSKAAVSDTAALFNIEGNGRHRWGPGGSGAFDVDLTRSSVGLLSLTGAIRASGDVAANFSTTNQVWVGHTGGALYAGITFGSALDTNLYRASAGVLKTDNELDIAGVFAAAWNGSAWNFRVTSALIGLFGSTGAGKQTISGSRGGNAALASLLTGLANYGLITDSTTA